MVIVKMGLQLLFLLGCVVICFSASQGESTEMVKIQLSESLRNVGDYVDVSCQFLNPALKVKTCKYKIGKYYYDFTEKDTVEANGDMYYNSTDGGFKNGHCTVTFMVKEEHNGKITCQLSPENTFDSYEDTADLVVALAPSVPHLLLSPIDPTEGSNVTAACWVEGGRPDATISFRIDGRELKAVNEKAIRQEEAGKKTFIVNDAVWTVSADDDQKIVMCIVNHPSWPEAKNVSNMVLVRYAPKLYVAQKKTIGKIWTFTDLKMEGVNNTVTFRVRSVPEPINVEWRFGKKVLRPETTEGHLVASKPSTETKHGKRYFVYSLTFTNLTAEDLKMNYTFSVRNSLGGISKEFRIESQAQVAEANFTMMIVLVAVGALVVVIGTAGIVVAKRNEKMCFASKPPEHTVQVIQSE